MYIYTVYIYMYMYDIMMYMYIHVCACVYTMYMYIKLYLYGIFPTIMYIHNVHVPVCRIMSLKELVSAANQSVDQSKLVLCHVQYVHVRDQNDQSKSSPEEIFFPKKYWCLKWDSKPRHSAL